MKDEISQEAKDALADLSRHKARERLLRDGASSIPAMQRRVRALAAERSIPPADFAKLMYKRVSASAIMDFCDKHGVSVEWLLCGDMHALQKMTRERKETKTAASIEAAYKTLLESFGKLDRAGQVAIVEYLKSQV